jgi:hypothetical protein
MTKEEAMDEILEAVRRGLLAQKTPGDTGAELASAMANVIADISWILRTQKTRSPLP